MCPVIFQSNTIELTMHTSFYCLELTLCYLWFHSLSQCNVIQYQTNLHSLSKSFQIQYCLNAGLVSVAYFLCQLLGAPSTRIAPTSGIQDSQALTLQLELFPTLLASAHLVSTLQECIINNGLARYYCSLFV